MAEFPALPLFTDAYLADTTHLNDAEHGRYLLLLMHLWRTPRQRFPNDHAWIARKMGRSVQAFENEVLPIMREFMQCDGNWWTQKRLASEWEYVRRTTSRQSDAAKARWNKAKGLSHGNAPSGNAPSGIAPTPTPTPTIEEGGSIEPPTRARRPDILADRMAWDRFWHAYPHKVGIGAARKAMPGALAKATIEDILAGLARYTHEKPPDQNWCNPSTFLNQERWRDERAPKSNGSNGHGPATTYFAAAAELLRERAEREIDPGTNINPDVPLLDGRRTPSGA